MTRPAASPASPASLERLKAKAKKRRQERGIALIMVLSAVTVLTVMLADFQDDTSADIAAATADRDSVIAEYMARSAINLSRLLVASEPTIRSAITPLFMMMKRKPPQLPVWQFSDRLLGAFNDEESAKDFAGTVGLDLSLGKNLGMKGGRFEVKIVDEDSKIDVNLGAANEIARIRLAKELMGVMLGPQYDPLFSGRDKNGNSSDRLQVCGALIDWADVDERAFSCDVASASPTSGGVEDAFYSLLPKPYKRKNAPYDSLEEVRMVRGISEEYWSTFVDPEPTNPDKRVMTVWGQGAINVNTANAQTLYSVLCAGAPQAPLCTDATQASTFLTGVTMAKGFTMGAPMFASAQDFVNMVKGKGQIGPLLATMGLKPVVFQSESEFEKSITTESKMFSIYSVGIVKGYRRETRVQIHAVVDFRSAPVVSSTSPLPLGANGANGPGSSAPGSTSASSSLGGGLGGSGPITAANQPSTGGQVVYYRIE